MHLVEFKKIYLYKNNFNIQNFRKLILILKITQKIFVLDKH